MRLALIACFDLGRSFGLKDGAFHIAALTGKNDADVVEIVNPFGLGTTLNLLAERRTKYDEPTTLDRWRSAAAAQLERMEFETAWVPGEMTKDTYVSKVRALVNSHPIDRAELTAYGVGTVLFYVEFAGGLPPSLVKGISRCFEFGAYREDIANAWLAAIEAHIVGRLNAERTLIGRISDWLFAWKPQLERISERPLPEPSEPVKGYRERMLIPFFLPVFMLTDLDDGEAYAHGGLVFRGKRLSSDDNHADALSDYELISFEYHGAMYYRWEDVLLLPRSWDDMPEPPTAQVGRMVDCIRIAHVFDAALRSFERRVESEIGRQFDGIAHVNSDGALGARDLNRLHSFALALSNTANFSTVTPSNEDQTYFSKFSRDARIAERRDAILDNCDVLYSIQAEDDKRKQDRLNTIVAVLTALTVISVLGDTVNFIDAVVPEGQAKGVLLPSLTQRLGLLAGIVALLVVAVLQTRR